MSLVGSKAGQLAKPPAGRTLDAVAAEECPVDLLDAAHHLFGLISIREQVEHPSVAQELVDVVEVPAAAPVDGPAGVGGELLGQGVDEDELLEERASRVKDSDLERLQVVELAEIGPSGLEHIAEEGADRRGSVGMGPAPDTHLEEHASLARARNHRA